ncbi:MAG TPA: hypothetical protein VFS53_00705 [Gemmatimonadota bacterium]|nr:hypothetical protein [Gemmatimonadota bacterium]
MKLDKPMVAIALAVGVFLGAACEGRTGADGDGQDTLDISMPEDAGERLEEAGREVGEAVGEGLEAAGGAIEEAGQEVQEEMREGAMPEDTVHM